MSRHAALVSIEVVERQILARLRPLAAEEVPLAEAAGRTLAESVHAAAPIPPFDNSSMDGFAARHADLASATPENPVRLAILGTIAAGDSPAAELTAGAAYRIYTGAPMPRGADAIVPIERVAHADAASVMIAYAPARGVFVRRAGEDLRAGDLALGAGSVLSAAAIGLLASIGIARARVHRQPRVAVHASGNELVEIEAAPAPGQIRNSNLYSIAARVAEIGGIPLRRPTLRDSMEGVRAGLRESLMLRPDAIITIGGISAGDLDFVREVAREIGESVEVRSVNMKPGKPLVDGLIGGVPFFGLPGNPASCLVSFEIFVRPALALLMGRQPADELRRRSARVRESLPLAGGSRVQFLRAQVEFDSRAGEYLLLPTGKQGSHILTSYARANCLVQLPEGKDGLAAGEMVEIILL